MQSTFFHTNQVEVVISDNCSDDDTPLVAAHFASQFPGKVRVNRNEVNVGPDRNFETALSMGSGTYLKLHNDDLFFRNGSIDETVKLIQACQAKKPVIFFTNGNRHTGKQIQICNNLDEFVACVSFFSTWIGGFGVWKSDFAALEHFFSRTDSRIVQTEVLLSQMASGKEAIVITEPFFFREDRYISRGYNIAEVFGHNYLSLLKPYLANGLLSEGNFQIEKKQVLLNQIIPLYFDKNNHFAKTGFFMHLGDYWHEPYFHEALEKLLFDGLGQ